MGDAKKFRDLLIDRIDNWYYDCFGYHLELWGGDNYSSYKTKVNNIVFGMDPYTNIDYLYSQTYSDEKARLSSFLLLNSLSGDYPNTEDVYFIVSPEKESLKIKSSLELLNRDIKNDIYSFIAKHQKYFQQILNGSDKVYVRYGLGNSYEAEICYFGEHPEANRIYLLIPDPWDNYDKVFHDICEKHIVKVAPADVDDTDTWDNKFNSIIKALTELNEYYVNSVLEKKKTCLVKLINKLKEYCR